MSKIRQAFSKAHPLFIPFFMAGHPTLDSTVKNILSFSEAGADIIELGIPFSDPVADGPVNQRASEIALKNGATLEWCLEEVAQVRLQGCDVPIILFTYLNPILAIGAEKFARNAKSSGVDGVLIVDLPPEAGEDLYKVFADNGLEIVLLVSPTTDHGRLKLYRKLNPCFIYYISRLGVTGTQDKLAESLGHEVEVLRKAVGSIPISVGFGISTLEQACEVAGIAEGVIIGSLLVKALEDGGSIESLIGKLAQAIHMRKTAI